MDHDLRRLALDGISPSKLYGVDIVDNWDLGYDLFRDRDRFAAHFVEADVLAKAEDLKELEGKVDVVSVFHVLHQ